MTSKNINNPTELNKKLFNKLFFKCPSVRKLPEDIIEHNGVTFKKTINHIFFSSDEKIWFANTETEDKFIYFFGRYEGHITNLNNLNESLMIDFDKKETLNSECLGLIYVNQNNIEIAINQEKLMEKYPNFKHLNEFDIHQINIFKNYSEIINTIVIGKLDDDFFDNFKHLVEDLKHSNKSIPKKEEILTNNDRCIICNKKTANTQKSHDKTIKELSKLKPEICNECVEKILIYEFYTEISDSLKNNETKDLQIAKEKFASDYAFEYCLKLLEEYKIIDYIGIKKLFYTLDRNNEILIKYSKFSDEKHTILNELKSIKIPQTQNKKVNAEFKKTNLNKNTITKMNLFINSLSSGKSYERSLKIAGVSHDKVNSWYKFGKRGDVDYIPFYEKYEKIRPKDEELQKRMNDFLNSLENDKTEDEALKEAGIDKATLKNWIRLSKQNEIDYIGFAKKYRDLKAVKKVDKNQQLIQEYINLTSQGKTNKEIFEELNIPRFKIKNWKTQGELGNKKYEEFYKTYLKQVEKEESSKRDEFVKLIDEGKTNKEAFNQIKIPKLKTKEWIEKGKNGEEDYKDFYEAYTRYFTFETKKEIKDVETIELEKIEEIIETAEENEVKTCEICGRSINIKSKRNICKKCQKKQYACKILQKLLHAVKPGIEFRKEDLEKLNLHKFQIQDYIWTLQDMNLINENNNKFSLKNKEVLDSFVSDIHGEPLIYDSEEGNVKLNKTCKTCGKTLKIDKFFKSENSPDGYEDNCRDCKKLISTATYLNEITQHVDYNSKFSENELLPYFNNPFKLQGMLFSLIDNDLLVKNFEDNTYTFTDEKTAKEFIDKYYSKEHNIATHEVTSDKTETNITPTVKEDSTHITAKDPSEYTKQDQMKIILNAMSEGKSRKEAAELASVPLYKITHWYNEGRQRFGKENIEFYKKLQKIEKQQKNNSKQLENKMNLFIQKLKQCKNKDEALLKSKISSSEVDNWLELGKTANQPYAKFYEDYWITINELSKDPIIEFQNKDPHRKIFLENLRVGKTKEQSAEFSSLSLTIIDEWYLKGKNGEKPFDEFYYKCQEIIGNSAAKTQTGKSKEDKLNEILKPLDEKYEISFRSSPMNRTGIAWTNIIGKQWVYQKQINGKTAKFSSGNIYELYDQIKENNLPWGIRDYQRAKPLIEKYDIIEVERNNDNNQEDETTINMENVDEGIYAPLPEKYEIAFKSSPMNKTGIAWVNNTATGTKWIYEKRLNGKFIKIEDANIYNLYKKVKSEGYVWGIRDYEKAKRIINIPDDFQIPKKENESKSEFIPEYIDPAIYAPLPKELEVTFASNSSNKTGIAWVNKTYNVWSYSRMVNGEKVYLKDENIYELFDKVQNRNLDWGIRNYPKARKHIKIPEDYKPPEETEESETSGILNPLPEKYKNTFNQSQPNKTGIAWVNKIGKKWVYQRKVNGIPIKFSDPNIYKLHEVVINNNHIWGIIDYDKAKNIIEDFDSTEMMQGTEEVSSYSENIDTGIPIVNIDPAIYAPIDEKFNENLDLKKNTGIAWVRQYNNHWIYSRKNDDDIIYFKEKDLYELFKRVKYEGQEWGIYDYDKARNYIQIPSDLNPQQKEKPTEPKKAYRPDVTVNYIGINESKYNIIIKGLIQNNELIDLLNKLKYFEGDIKRIITNSIQNKADILIELEINSMELRVFEEKIKEIGWKINK